MTHARTPVRSTALLLVAATCLIAAAARRPDPAAPTHQPHASDWISPDTLARAVYAVVSGPPAAPRDWDRYRDLFRPDARLMTFSGPDDTPVLHAMGVEEYIRSYGPSFLERGVFEHEAHARTDRFRHFAQRLSVCEYRWERADGPPSGQSLVTMQFVHDGRRWWIAGMIWEVADDDHPIPSIGG